jgi:hypothetical protein
MSLTTTKKGMLEKWQVSLSDDRRTRPFWWVRSRSRKSELKCYRI